MRKIIALSMVIASTSMAAPKYLVNGKETDPAAAAMAAMDSKNVVMQCAQVTLKINAKGSMSLKKTDTSGDWQAVSKK